MFTYAEFAQRVYSTGMLSDPWLNGRERFRLEPVLLAPAQLAAFYQAAECIAQIYQELAEIVWANPTWLDEFFQLGQTCICGATRRHRGDRTANRPRSCRVDGLLKLRRKSSRADIGRGAC